MKRIIFFDIDGTLIDVPRGLSEPSEATRYAIKELINNGDLVFIASGRYKGNLPRKVLELNPSGYILSNGAYIEYQGKPLYEKAFDTDIFNKLNEYCIEHNCLFTGETQEYVYSPRLDDRFNNYLKKWKIDYVKVSDKKDGVTFYKCCAFFEDRDSAIQFEKEFDGIVDYRAQTADPESLSYDINIFGVNKGSAVNVLIDKLGIKKEDTYCFCDGSNDLELVKACINSYVMKNGVDELKRIAFGIADDVIEDGAYKKLVELDMIKARHD